MTLMGTRQPPCSSSSRAMVVVTAGMASSKQQPLGAMAACSRVG
jgi:hypothetical protein